MVKSIQECALVQNVIKFIIVRKIVNVTIGLHTRSCVTGSTSGFTEGPFLIIAGCISDVGVFWLPREAILQGVLREGAY